MEKKSSLWKLLVSYLVPVEGTLLGRLALPARRARQEVWRGLQFSLTYRYLPLVVAVLAGFFVLPTVWSGLSVDDDLLHREMIRSSSLPATTAHLFTFLDPRTTPARIDQGSLPWWASDQVSIAFWRPLAAFSLWLDYQAWPDSPVLMHLHSLLWYVALCTLVAIFYRRFMGRRVAAGLAAILFAVNVPHFNSVIAINARNVLQTAFFGLAAVYLYDRWRRQGWGPGVWLVPLCLLGSLLSAEAGLATTAYLGAYALCLDHGPWRRRLASLIPSAATVVAWRLLYQWQHYGAFGSAFYIDPVREPLRFAAAVLANAPLLLAGQWVLPDPGLFALFSMGGRLIYWVVAVLLVALVGAGLWPLLRRDRLTRFWTVGMLLAVVPICAVNPATGRHLIFVGIGALGLLAQLVVGLWEHHPRLPVHRAWRLPAWSVSLLLLVLQGVIYPTLVFFVPAVLGGALYTAMEDLGPLPGCERQDVIVVNPPSPGQSIYMLSLRAFRGQPVPAHLRMLAPGHSPVQVTRLDAHTLLVRPENGYLLQPGAPAGARRDWLPIFHPAFATQYGEAFLRSPGAALQVGDQVVLSGVHLQVTALTADGRPQEVRVTFDRPLEDASLRWLRWDWQDQAFEPFSLPGIGQSVQVAGAF